MRQSGENRRSQGRTSLWEARRKAPSHFALNAGTAGPDPGPHPLGSGPLLFMNAPERIAHANCPVPARLSFRSSFIPEREVFSGAIRRRFL